MNLIWCTSGAGFLQEKLKKGESLDDSEINFLVMRALESLGAERVLETDTQEEQAAIQVKKSPLQMGIL